jgi:chromosome segregation ATPase
VQQRLTDVSRGIEEQILALTATIEKNLIRRVDGLLAGLTATVRRDVERVRERTRAIENRLADLSKDGARELIAPLQAVANGASERAAAALARGEEFGLRLEQLERRIAELTRSNARGTLDGDEFRQRLDRIDQRLTDLGREVGTKLSELGALRERLTRMEGRVLESSKEQIGRAGETAGLRDRLARLEARLSDLSKEQLARAVETAGLRERLFRLERAGGPAAAAGPFHEAARVPAED